MPEPMKKRGRPAKHGDNSGRIYAEPAVPNRYPVNAKRAHIDAMNWDERSAKMRSDALARRRR